MNCREFQFALDEYAVGRLAPELRTAMDTHRISCSACEAAYREEAALRTQFRELPAPSLATHDLWNQVAAQISHPVTSARSIWKRWTVAALVPAMSFAALAFILMPRPQQQPTEMPLHVTLVSHEETVVDNVLNMRRMDVADRDGLIEQTLTQP